MSKVCRQCMMNLTEDAFRPYAARGKGIRQTTRGFHTVCKDCENINMQAAAFLTNKRDNPERKKQFVDYYTVVQNLGGKMPPVGARMLGIEPTPHQKQATSNVLSDKLMAMAAQQQSGAEAACKVFMDHLRLRNFSSLEAATQRFDALKAELKSQGLFEEADKLLEDWEMDED